MLACWDVISKSLLEFFFPLSQSGYILKSSKAVCLFFFFFVICLHIYILSLVYLFDIVSQKFAEESRYWGAFGLYVCISMEYFSFGLSGGFLSLSLAAFMVPAWILYSYGNESLR
ncbi:hypothetical protein Hanom_Chr13g01197681 [Helianthus anomalus]